MFHKTNSVRKQVVMARCTNTIDKERLNIEKKVKGESVGSENVTDKSVSQQCSFWITQMIRGGILKPKNRIGEKARMECDCQ
jgi:hypothetical protein